jgi:hypothetical protein
MLYCNESIFAFCSVCTFVCVGMEWDGIGWIG